MKSEQGKSLPHKRHVWRNEIFSPPKISDNDVNDFLDFILILYVVGALAFVKIQAKSHKLTKYAPFDERKFR